MALGVSYTAFLDELEKISEVPSQIGRLVRRDKFPSDDDDAPKNQDRASYCTSATHSSGDPERRDPVARAVGPVVGDIQ